MKRDRKLNVFPRLHAAKAILPLVLAFIFGVTLFRHSVLCGLALCIPAGTFLVGGIILCWPRARGSAVTCQPGSKTAENTELNTEQSESSVRQ